MTATISKIVWLAFGLVWFALRLTPRRHSRKTPIRYSGRNAREFITGLPKLGVVPGRAFPPLDNYLRVTIGTDAEMTKFRSAFWQMYKAS